MYDPTNIRSIQVILRLERVLPIQVPLDVILEMLTLRDFVNVIEELVLDNVKQVSGEEAQNLDKGK